jgi:hypothetical protein
MATNVFLSHAATDIELVRKVASHAHPLGVTTYAYEDHPQAGSPVAAKLEASIRESDAVLVLLTQNSQHRPSVHTEVGLARALEKPIIPVIEVGVDPLQFVFLQGLEWIILDTAKIDEALLGIQHSLNRVAKNIARQNTLLTAALLLVVAALIYYAATRNE